MIFFRVSYFNFLISVDVFWSFRNAFWESGIKKFRMENSPVPFGLRSLSETVMLLWVHPEKSQLCGHLSSAWRTCLNHWWESELLLGNSLSLLDKMLGPSMHISSIRSIKEDFIAHLVSICSHHKLLRILIIVKYILGRRSSFIY